MEKESLNSLLELRDFISTELDPEGGLDNSQRIFRPLTDGLGLESPKSAFAPKPPVVEKKQELQPRPPMPPPVPERPQRMEMPPLPTPTPRPQMSGLASVIETASTLAEPLSSDARAEMMLEPKTSPPPLPEASLIRRMLAGLIDQVFVLTLFALAMVVTLRTLGANMIFSTDFSAAQNPMIIRFAVLEYATVWLAYFAITIGLLEVTFGMWVWGLRLSFGEDQSTSRFLKKAFRAFISFFFFAPLFPVVLLVFRSRGRNLLDYLSGTKLYRVVNA